MYTYLKKFLHFICCYRKNYNFESDTNIIILKNVSSDSLKLAKPTTPKIEDDDWCKV
jgi:hypothetical protein